MIPSYSAARTTIFHTRTNPACRALRDIEALSE